MPEVSTTTERAEPAELERFVNAGKPNQYIEVATGRYVITQQGQSPESVCAEADAPEPIDLVWYASNRRWEVEVGGVTVGGLTIPTTDRAKLLIMGAAKVLDDDDTSPFIVGGVNYGRRTGLQFQEMLLAITGHVQMTMRKLAEVLDGIEAGTVTDIAGVNAVFDK